MSPIFDAHYVIPSTAINASSGIHLSFLQQMMQDAASRHAEQLGVGHRTLKEKGKTFMLSRLRVVFAGDQPGVGDSFTLQTWPRGIERLWALRDFIGCDAEGREFLKASSGWLVVNTQTMRVDRPRDVLAGLTPHPVMAIKEILPLPEWSDDLPIVDERRVRFSDLDINQHLNNTRYTDWICDAVAASQGTSLKVLSLSVNFLNQLKFDEKVRIAVKEEESDSFVVQGASDRQSFLARVTVRP